MGQPTLKAQQSTRTKAALIAAGRELFARHGYAGVTAEDIAAAANLTTGAVYHQFGSKRGLFLGVFEAVEAELTARIGAAATSGPGPWEGFTAAAAAFLDSAAEPDVRQVVLIDGRSVLGWEAWHDVMARYGLGLTRAAIGQLMEAGLLRPAPLDALSAGVFGALSELALFVATAEDPPSAGEEARGALAVLVESLRK